MPKAETKRVAAAVVSGLMLTAAFPNLEVSWLAWCALVPLLLALSGTPAGAGFRLGFITGLVHYLTLTYWLAHTMTTYGGLPWVLAVPILFLLAATLALFSAAFAWIVAISGPTPFLSLFLIPSAWAGLEYVRSFLLSGFPWELLGYSQYRLLPLIQVADILGPYGVSFLIVAVNTGLASVVICLGRCKWFGRPVTGRLILASTITLVIAMAAVMIYGDRRIRSLDAKINDASVRTVAAIQGNIPQNAKWDPQFQQTTTLKYIELSSTFKTTKVDLVVWPESATPFYLYNNPFLTRMVIAGINEIGADFLIGSPSAMRREGKVIYYNSAYLIDQFGKPMGKYDKAHLVPFGEYVPFKRYLPFLGKMVAQVGDFEAGPTGKTLKWGDQRLGVLICYELIFPELTRDQVKSGASLLVNLTNDAWYGCTSAPYQHFSMAVFRAVENKRALVRAANTGITGFIDPVGRIQQTTGLFKAAAIHQAVHLIDLETVYTRMGDLFAKACLIATALLALCFFILRKRKGL